MQALRIEYWQEVVKLFKGYLRFVPDEFVDLQVCLDAVKFDAENLSVVPQRFQMRRDVYLGIAEKNPGMLRYFPAQFVTKELLETFINIHVNALQYIPPQYITIELATEYFQDVPGRKYRHALKFVPLNSKPPAVCELAIARCPTNIRYVPSNFFTEERHYILAISHYVKEISDLPERFQTRSFYRKLVESDADVLDFVPPEFIDLDICEAAVKSFRFALCRVPDKYKTKDFCRTAVEYHPEAITYVPKKYRSKDMCASVIERMPEMADLPFLYKYLTEEICIAGVKRDPRMLENLPDRFRTKPVCEIAVKMDPALIFSVPRSVKNRELCMMAVENRYDTFGFVPEELIDEEMCKLVLSKMPGTLVVPFVNIIKKVMDIVLVDEQIIIDSCTAEIIHVSASNTQRFIFVDL